MYLLYHILTLVSTCSSANFFVCQEPNQKQTCDSGKNRAKRRGACPRRHWFDLPELSPAGVCPSAALARPAGAVPGGGCAPGGTGSTCRSCPRRGVCPRRHLLSLPRGRGPSQTPPSRATDSSISPGPPSPWLPALPIENRFLLFLRRIASSLRGVPAWQGL